MWEIQEKFQGWVKAVWGVFENSESRSGCGHGSTMPLFGRCVSVHVRKIVVRYRVNPRDAATALASRWILYDYVPARLCVACRRRFVREISIAGRPSNLTMLDRQWHLPCLAHLTQYWRQNTRNSANYTVQAPFTAAITHADDSRRSKAFSCVCVWWFSLCVSVCLSVCLHDKTKTADTTIAKLATGIVHHESVLAISLISKGKGHGHRVRKCKNVLQAIEWPAWVLHSIEWPVSSWYKWCSDMRKV